MKDTNEKQIQEIKDILEKEHGREFTWQEASAAVHTLERFAEIALESIEIENNRKEKLKAYPKGYHLHVKFVVPTSKKKRHGMIYMV